MGVIGQYLLATAMSLLLVLAPALCMCSSATAEAAMPAEHQCCAAEAASEDLPLPHGESCTHCGAQEITPLLTHGTNPGDFTPVAVLSFAPQIEGLVFRTAAAPVVEKIGSPPDTPVRLHTCSLT